MSDAVIISIVTGIVTIILQILTLYNGNRTHEAVNSKMSALLELTASASKAEGVLQQKEQQ